MVQVSYPGVYIQEVSSGVKTITGVATSITAFLGRTNKGPLNRAVRCLSHADFVRTFAGSPVESELALSVKQFYDNGGADCYVVRLARNARKAAIQLENYGGTAVLIASAKAEGLWGNGLRLEVDYNTPAPGDTFNLRVIQEEAGAVVATEAFTNLSMDYTSSRFAPAFVSQSSALIDLMLDPALDNPADPTSDYQTTASLPGFSESRRPLAASGDSMNDVATELISLLADGHAFEISVDNSPWVGVSLQGLASTGATLVNDLQTRINTALSALVPAPTVAVTIRDDGAFGQFLRLTASSGNLANVRVRRAPANDLASVLMLGADNGGAELSRWSVFRPAANGFVLRVGTSALGLENLQLLPAIQQGTITGVTIGADPAIALNAAPNNLITTPPGTNLWIQDAVAGSVTGNNDGVREKLRIIASAITNAAGGHYRAEVHGYQLAIYPKTGTFNEAPAAVTFAGVGIPALTANTRQYKLGFDGTSAFATGGSFTPGTTTFSNADDGADGDAPDFATYVGDPVQHTGIHALDTVDLFNLMVMPRDENVTATDRLDVLGPASVYCRSRRAFLIVEAPDNWTGATGLPAVVQNTALIDDVRARVVKDHSAVFYPKIRVNDRGVVRTVGSGGAIAGLMARTDASRGVWKAPAGTEADLRAISGLSVKLTDLENGVLNKLGVNCARSFVSGFVNWGARTLEGADDLGSEWKYVPIRRLALFIEESLYRGTQWVVFEPNDEPLWAKIRLNVGAFMNGLFRQGAFQGSTPSQAFYVKCDAETTPQADRNLGIVNIEVGFAPLKPAEFVVIKIQQIAGDLS
ncbi:MAG TPA: phage tail sheath C-terminal domain-containing protein [Opitutaceae bacterium]